MKFPTVLTIMTIHVIVFVATIMIMTINSVTITDLKMMIIKKKETMIMMMMTMMMIISCCKIDPVLNLTLMMLMKMLTVVIVSRRDSIMTVPTA